jgi:hypothetical protein
MQNRKNKLKKGGVMKSRRLKQIIGLFYFFMYAVIVKNVNTLHSGLSRVLLCSEFAFLGLGVRAAIYYGVFKRDQEKELSGLDIEATIFNYIIYGFKLAVLICFFYLIFFNTLKIIGPSQFFITSLLIFSYIGFFSDEIALPYIKK